MAQVPVSVDVTDTPVPSQLLRFLPAKTALTQALQSLVIMGRQDDEDLLRRSIKLFEETEMDMSPEGRPNMEKHCSNFAVVLLNCYQCTGDWRLMVEAVDLAGVSISEVCPTGHPSRAFYCITLAESIWQYHRRTTSGDQRPLIQAIEFQQKWLALLPPGHLERAQFCGALGLLLWTRYHSTGDNQSLVEAINLQRESLALCPLGHPYRLSSCRNLGRSLTMRYETTGNCQLLTEAIDLFREALALCPSGHPERDSSCHNLAISLQSYYGRTSDVVLLSESINLRRESLALRPLGHPDHAVACNNLAMSLWMYSNNTTDDRLLTEAIDLSRISLALCPPGHPIRISSCMVLSSSLKSLYDRNGGDLTSNQRDSIPICSYGNSDRVQVFVDSAGPVHRRYNSAEGQDLLTEIISLQRESLSLCYKRDIKRALSCDNLAYTLQSYYSRTRDKQLLIEAIDLHWEALSLHPTGDIHRSQSCNNLATSLLMYFESTGSDVMLTEAIGLHREALSLRPVGHPYRALSCHNLAVSLQTQYSCGGEIQLLAEAIDLHREALSLHCSGHPDRAQSCSHLAKALRMRYDTTGDNLLLTEIGGICSEGLTLANSSSQWRHNSTLAWVCLQPRTQLCNITSAIQYLSQSLVHHPDNVPEAVADSIHLLNLIWSHGNDLETQSYSALAIVYQRLSRLLPFLMNPILDTSLQLDALRSCHRLGSDAFINGVLAGIWDSGMEELETVHGLYWSQTLHYRDPQLQDVPAELARTLESLLKAISTSPTQDEPTEMARTSLTFRDIQHDRVTRVYALLRQIRALPGLERFMLGETSDVLHSVAALHPVVILVGARGHFFAVLLKSKDRECSPMELNLSEKEFHAISQVQYVTRTHRGATTTPANATWGAHDDRGIRREGALSLHTHHQMQQLWLRIVKPVIDELGLKPVNGKKRPRLHWYPTGAFTALPLHAAGIHDGPVDLRESCADYVVSSYTPTITTLLRAQRTMKSLRKDSARIALMAEKRALESHLQVIDEVEAEAEAVAALARSRYVQMVEQLPSPVSISETCRAMQTANIVHIACHGIQDSTNALQSGFCLGDGRLTISELMQMKMDNPFLAFLSACETAKGDHGQPDQVMHLAAAMMFVGFKAVIATMWAISDVDGPKVATWFYEELFANDIIDGDTVAYALDTAVGKLRQSGVSLDRWAPFIHMGV